MRNAPSLSSSYSESSEPRDVSTIAILFFALVGAAMGHCWWVGDHVASATTAIIGLGGALGYWYGIWRTIGSSVGLYVGFEYAAPTAAQVVPMVEKQFGQTIPSNAALLISGGLVGLGVTLVFFVVGALMFRRSQTLKKYDRDVGFAFGLLNATAIMALTLWGLLAAEPKIHELRQLQVGQKNEESDSITNKLDLALVATKKSYVMFALREWNPFNEVVYLKNAKEQLESLIVERQANEHRSALPSESTGLNLSSEMQKLIQTMNKGSNDKIK